MGSAFLQPDLSSQGHSKTDNHKGCPYLLSKESKKRVAGSRNTLREGENPAEEAGLSLPNPILYLTRAIFLVAEYTSAVLSAGEPTVSL